MNRHRNPRSRRWVGWSIVVIVVVGLVGTGLGFWQAGYRPFIVHTGSMAPTHPSGDLLIVRPAESYRVGEVITFRHSADPTDLVTHRITEVTTQGFHTKGDANPTADVWTIRPDMVVGSAVAGLPGLGYAVHFLQQPTGIAAVLLAAIAIFLLWTLFFPAHPRRAETADHSDDAGSETGLRGPDQCVPDRTVPDRAVPDRADPDDSDHDRMDLDGCTVSDLADGDSLPDPDLPRTDRSDDELDQELFDMLLGLSSRA